MVTGLHISLVSLRIHLLRLLNLYLFSGLVLYPQPAGSSLSCAYRDSGLVFFPFVA